MSLPDDYFELLVILAGAFSLYTLKSRATAVLVGGAATAIVTGGGFMSGDLDVVAADDTAFHEAMLANGLWAPITCEAATIIRPIPPMALSLYRDHNSTGAPTFGNYLP